MMPTFDTWYQLSNYGIKYHIISLPVLHLIYEVLYRPASSAPLTPESASAYFVIHRVSQVIAAVSEVCNTKWKFEKTHLSAVVVLLFPTERKRRATRNASHEGNNKLSIVDQLARHWNSRIAARLLVRITWLVFAFSMA